ncbi:hypothetical protein BN2476_280059 [Paraburkholderia piptadeniae]|uniref:Uncharacterized protein n=1 Tax=Paraburkholderia piptadeniae TaxID=1701573 RepID=A0A1N7S1S6_9BURK|nr:hypothetical protein BN2476_280059 [Paraburkholderia piptadeniae]
MRLRARRLRFRLRFRCRLGLRFGCRFGVFNDDVHDDVSLSTTEGVSTGVGASTRVRRLSASLVSEAYFRPMPYSSPMQDGCRAAFFVGASWRQSDAGAPRRAPSSANSATRALWEMLAGIDVREPCRSM